METLKRLRTALKDNAHDLVWSIIGGAIGGAIGLLMVTLYLRSR